MQKEFSTVGGVKFTLRPAVGRYAQKAAVLADQLSKFPVLSDEDSNKYFELLESVLAFSLIGSSINDIKVGSELDLAVESISEIVMYLVGLADQPAQEDKKK